MRSKIRKITVSGRLFTLINAIQTLCSNDNDGYVGRIEDRVVIIVRNF